jgi:phosphate transport system substrate-binding protein
MTSTADLPEEDSKLMLFAEVAQGWQLDRLYADLAEVKGNPLTETEKTCLRGLLHRQTPGEIAAKLDRTVEDLLMELGSGLYRQIEVLTHKPTQSIRSSKVATWLEEAGYRLQRSTAEAAQPIEAEPFPTPSQRSFRIPWWDYRVILIELVAAIIAGVVATWITNPDRQTAPEANRSASTIACFTDVLDIPKGIFNVGGSTSWAEVRAQVDKAIQTTLPTFRPRYEHPFPSEGGVGSTTGIQMLTNGRLTVAQSSRPLTPAEREQAEQRGFSLQQTPVAIDAVAIAVHPQNSIPGLTVEQLKGIYTGEIQNWNQVGGADSKITVYIPPSTGWLEEGLLRGEELRADIQSVQNTTEGLRNLATDPSGIYYTTASLVVGQCSIRPLPLSAAGEEFVPPYDSATETCTAATPRQLNKTAFRNEQYPLTRNLYAIYKDYPGDSNVEEQAGRSYVNLLLSDQGQQLIEKSGFIPIRSSERTCPANPANPAG